jgi:hypothetical protein
MLTPLVRRWKLRQAKRIAKPLVLTVRDCLHSISDEKGELRSRDIRDDEFVLTYVYGMVVGGLERVGKQRDHVLAALALRQTFEYLFGEGQRRAELCTGLAKCHSGDFQHAARLGYSDTRKYAPGSEIPVGLIDHLRSYEDRS